MKYLNRRDYQRSMVTPKIEEIRAYIDSFEGTKSEKREYADDLECLWHIVEVVGSGIIIEEIDFMSVDSRIYSDLKRKYPKEFMTMIIHYEKEHRTICSGLRDGNRDHRYIEKYCRIPEY